MIKLTFQKWIINIICFKKQVWQRYELQYLKGKIRNTIVCKTVLSVKKIIPTSRTCVDKLLQMSYTLLVLLNKNVFAHGKSKMYTKYAYP